MRVPWLIHVWHDSFMCDMTQIYMWGHFVMSCAALPVQNSCETWLVHMCAMTHSCVCHASFMCVMNHSCVCHDSFMCVSWLLNVRDLTHTYVTRLCEFMRNLAQVVSHIYELCHEHRGVITLTWMFVTWLIYLWRDFVRSHFIGMWLIHMCAMTHIYVTRLCEVTFLWDVNHSYVCHDSFICVPWLIHMSIMTHLCVCHDSFMRDMTYIFCHTWMNRGTRMTHSYGTWLIYMGHDSFIWDMTHLYGTWLIHIYVWQDSLFHVSCAMTHSL